MTLTFSGHRCMCMESIEQNRQYHQNIQIYMKMLGCNNFYIMSIL